MLSLRTRPSFSLAFSPSRHLHQPTPSSSFKPYTQCTPYGTRFCIKMSTQAVEHIVLFKVKNNTDQSKVTAMVNELNSLVSLDQVLHLTVGPVLRNRSTSLDFTHMLHSRYKTKQDLADYSAHPGHLAVVRGSVLPICDDIMAVDWVAEELHGGDLVPPLGSAIRVSFLKLKENLGDEIKNEVLGAVRGVKDSVNMREISELSFGENFSPARAKGFSIASLAVFQGPSELDANAELVDYQKKDKVGEHLESVVVVDYVVPSRSARFATL